jgi:hypothetical protein
MANPQNLNRYSYVNNAPVRLNDPSGHRPCENPNGGTCLSEKQVTKKWITSHQRLRTKGSKNDDHARTPIAELTQSPVDPFSPEGLIDSYGDDICNYIFGEDFALVCDPNTWYNTSDKFYDVGQEFEISLAPDYITLQLGIPILPVISPLFSLAVTGTYSNGHLYSAIGINIAKTFSTMTLWGIPFSANVSGGWLTGVDGKATPSQTHDFLTGLAVNGSIGALVGAGGTINWSGLAFETGFYTAQVGVTATYTWLDIDLGNNDWDLFP